VISTVVAYLAGAAAVQRLSAAVGGAVAYIEVIAASLFALLLLNEKLETNQIIGGVIVLFGAFVAQSSVGKVTPPEGLPTVDDELYGLHRGDIVGAAPGNDH